MYKYNYSFIRLEKTRKISRSTYFPISCIIGKPYKHFSNTIRKVRNKRESYKRKYMIFLFLDFFQFFKFSLTIFNYFHFTVFFPEWNFCNKKIPSISEWHLNQSVISSNRFDVGAADRI